LASSFTFDSLLTEFVRVLSIPTPDWVPSTIVYQMLLADSASYDALLTHAQTALGPQRGLRYLRKHRRLAETFPPSVRATLPTLSVTHALCAMQAAHVYASGVEAQPLWWAQQACQWGWSVRTWRHLSRASFPVTPAAWSIPDPALRLRALVGSAHLWLTRLEAEGAALAPSYALTLEPFDPASPDTSESPPSSLPGPLRLLAWKVSRWNVYYAPIMRYRLGVPLPSALAHVS